MAYKKVIRDINLVETEDQFRDYLAHKSYGSKRMIKVFNRQFLYIQKPTFSVDDDRVILSKDKNYGYPKFVLGASKKNNGQVYIDTGFLEITEEGDIIPNWSAFDNDMSFDKLAKKGIKGLRHIKSISCDITKLYEEIFPAKKERW